MRSSTHLSNQTSVHFSLPDSRAKNEKITIMEVMEDFGINVHAIITVQDIYEYLKQDGSYGDILTKMKEYMDTYCVF